MGEKIAGTWCSVDAQGEGGGCLAEGAIGTDRPSMEAFCGISAMAKCPIELADLWRASRHRFEAGPEGYEMSVLSCHYRFMLHRSRANPAPDLTKWRGFVQRNDVVSA